MFEIHLTKAIVVVAKREFKGTTYIDVRKHFDEDGELKPTKSGITINPADWKQFVEELVENHLSVV